MNDCYCDTRYLPKGTVVNVREHTQPKGKGLSYPAMRDETLAEDCNGVGWDIVDLESGTSVYSFSVTPARKTR